MSSPVFTWLETSFVPLVPSPLALRGDLSSKSQDPLYKKYLEQFKDPLILLLLGSVALSVLIKQYDDAISIFMAVVIVATVSHALLYLCIAVE